ncbi:fibronectin type III-like domain-contianing protein [Streptomyces sp. NPDC013157]|uniref:fibronectin type III-like domain-contianing protein n=1 Tax=Streptomyces sp. NPDC013157 TaxID=3364861 RepID=UPI0036BD4BFD
MSYDTEVATDGRLTVSAVAANSGARAAATVVQLYVGLRTPGLIRPAQQLAGFERIVLAGASGGGSRFTVSKASDTPVDTPYAGQADSSQSEARAFSARLDQALQ